MASQGIVRSFLSALVVEGEREMGERKCTSDTAEVDPVSRRRHCTYHSACDRGWKDGHRDVSCTYVSQVCSCLGTLVRRGSSRLQLGVPRSMSSFEKYHKPQLLRLSHVDPSDAPSPQSQSAEAGEGQRPSEFVS